MNKCVQIGNKKIGKKNNNNKKRYFSFIQNWISSELLCKQRFEDSRSSVQLGRCGMEGHICLFVRSLHSHNEFCERPTAFGKIMSVSGQWVHSSINSNYIIKVSWLQIKMKNAQRILLLYIHQALPPHSTLHPVLSETATREGRLHGFFFWFFFTCTAPAAADGVAPCLSCVAGSYLSTLALNN